MPLTGIKTVTSARNGVGAFILPCRRLDFHYCDFFASSSGLNAFLTSPLLTTLTSQHPSCEFRISPKPNHHPVIKAHYINGREKAVCVKNMDMATVLKRAQILLQNSGAKNKKLGSRKVVSENENVRGIWSAMHGGIKSI